MLSLVGSILNSYLGDDDDHDTYGVPDGFNSNKKDIIKTKDNNKSMSYTLYIDEKRRVSNIAKNKYT